MDRNALRNARLMLVFLIGGLAGCGGSSDSAPTPPTVSVLSSDPSRVTGDTALVQVGPSAGTVMLNGKDISSSFAGAGTTRTALVSGLALGANQLAVADANGATTNVVLTDHPISGPLLSGLQQMPFICETSTFILPDGSNLGPATDANCSAPSKVIYMYKTTSGTYKPYAPAGARPADMGTFTTSTGATMDYTIRLQTGVINRGIYQIAFVHPPNTPLPTPGARIASWNGGLVYAFFGGCGVAYRQGRSTANAVGNIDGAADALDQGFAVATSSLNVLGNDCNDVINAETAAMVKEYFVKQFGVPTHTIGAGGSGASMQQHLLAQNYPGILDGLLPGRSFADTLTVLQYASDCPLLNNYFAKTGTTWTGPQQVAVSGFFQYGMCSTAWLNYLPRWVSPLASGCDLAIPRSLLYDPVTNPTGTRCDYFSNMVNIWGTDTNGVARRALDNVGVQYGLAAFNAGTITAAQFLDLNQNIGGFDVGANIVAARTSADPEALRISYQTGRVNEGSGLDSLPILDLRGYNDYNVPADVHSQHTTFEMRARLLANNGTADNEVMWVTPSLGSLGLDLTTPTSPLRQAQRMALTVMDQWLTAIESDTSSDPMKVKVIRNKPAQATEGCFDAAMNKINQSLTYPGTGQCGTMYPPHGDPRIAAGAPIAGDIIKCQLKTPARADYMQAFTDPQWATMATVFPGGVCDYSVPGVSQQVRSVTWRRF
jgi:Tannase-like family of unknown function (DUF6351)